MSQVSFRVLIVCTGNTCRSPMAEGILKSLLQQAGANHIDVSSAGIAGMEQYPASGNAVEAAKLWNVDISGHRSRGISRELIETSDLILAMSPNHVDHILNISSSARSKTFLIKGFPDPYSPTQEGVQDPIGGPLEQYNHTYLELDEILRRIVGRIIELSSTSGD